MEGLLPIRPRPYADELFSSWVIRLAHANFQRLPAFTFQLTGDPNFWVHDPDRHPRAGVLQMFARVTGLSEETVEALTLRRFVGVMLPPLLPRASVRWVMPLFKTGYRRDRPGLSCCPACLREALYLRQHWRLSFVTVCIRHQCMLLGACPECHAPFAPQRNDLGVGQDWSLNPDPSLSHCLDCGMDLREADTETADPSLVEFQERLLYGARTGWMAWDSLKEVPSIEGFDVLHQLLNVLMQPEPGRYLAEVLERPGPQRLSERRNRSFEDFDLEGRRALLGQLGYLIGDWPHRLLGVCAGAGITRKPLVVNLPVVPSWYDLVAEQVSRANGRRSDRRVPLLPHLTLEGIAQRRDTALTATEHQRWNLLWHYQQHPEMLPIARKLSLRWDLVWRTVTRYNRDGPQAIDNPQRNRNNLRRRLLSPAQEEELRQLQPIGRLSNVQMADWMEERTGKRPSASTIWMYRRGLESHSTEGRRAAPEERGNQAEASRLIDRQLPS